MSNLHCASSSVRSEPAATFPSSAVLYWLPLVIAVIVGLAFQGSRGLAETSETRYAECAREMVVSGNWLEPMLEFQPHWTKPPVAYWCIAAGMKVFGFNAWGARVPGALALLVGAWAVLVAGRRLWGDRTGAIAATAFAVGLPAFGAYTVTTDIFLGAAETLALAAFVFAATEPEAGRRRGYTVAMWFAWGAAFLIKGPPAWLPLLAIIPWNLMQPRARRVPLGYWPGLVCFVVVSLSWYLAMLRRHPDLLGYYVGTEIVARVSSDLGHNRAWYKAIEIFGPTMLGSVGAFGIWAAVLAWRDGWGGAAKWRALWAARDPRLLLLGWVVLPLVVFCLSRSKLHLYVLPLAAPVALLAGRVLASRVGWRAFRNVAIGSVLALVSVKAATALAWSNRRDMARLAGEVRAELAQMPADVPVVFWDEPNNHGLTFYLQCGAHALPERVSPDEKSKFETWTVAEFAGRLGDGAYDRGALLVCSARRREAMDAALPRLPVVGEARGRFWHLLRLGRLDAAGAPEKNRP